VAHRHPNAPAAELDPDERLALGHHLFGSAGLEVIGHDHEIASFTDDAIDLTRYTVVVSSDSNRYVSRIEIDRVTEEHDLDRRNKQDQRDGRSFVDEMQDSTRATASTRAMRRQRTETVTLRSGNTAWKTQAPHPRAALPRGRCRRG